MPGPSVLDGIIRLCSFQCQCYRAIREARYPSSCRCELRCRDGLMHWMRVAQRVWPMRSKSAAPTWMVCLHQKPCKASRSAGLVLRLSSNYLRMRSSATIRSHVARALRVLQRSPSLTCCAHATFGDRLDPQRTPHVRNASPTTTTAGDRTSVMHALAALHRKASSPPLDEARFPRGWAENIEHMLLRAPNRACTAVHRASAYMHARPRADHVVGRARQLRGSWRSLTRRLTFLFLIRCTWMLCKTISSSTGFDPPPSERRWEQLVCKDGF